jgi:hypothetical protein
VRSDAPAGILEERQRAGEPVAVEHRLNDAGLRERVREPEALAEAGHAVRVHLERIPTAQVDEA